MASPLLTLPKTIGKAFSGIFFAAVLERDTATPGPNDWTPGEVTTVNHSCKALIEAWSSFQLSGGLVAAGDRKVMILASTVAVQPEAGDRITVRGETFTIVSDGGSMPAVSTDPAKAVWICRGRA